MGNLQFLGLTGANRGISPVYEQQIGRIGVSAPIDKMHQATGLYEKCQELSKKDGYSPDVSGSACGRRLDLCKNGSIDNQNWG